MTTCKRVRDVRHGSVIDARFDAPLRVGDHGGLAGDDGLDVLAGLRRVTG